MRVSPAKGSYILVLQLAQEQRLTAGKLGTFTFPAGYYLYFGSALNGLRARVQRHLRPDKKYHWHIDRLTPVAEPRQVWWMIGPERQECRWFHQSLACPGFTVPAPGFGSSDCRCPAHLAFTPHWSVVTALQRKLAREPGLQISQRRTDDGSFRLEIP